MANKWFRVISMVPVCVNYGNGNVVSFPRDKIFEADENLPDIKRLLHRVPTRIVAAPADETNGYRAPSDKRPLPPEKVAAPRPSSLPKTMIKGKVRQVAAVVRGPGL